MKASPLLRAWLARLASMGVAFRMRHHWLGWDDQGRLAFAAPGESLSVTADATVLALGGASWPRLGSDGDWVALLEKPTSRSLRCSRQLRLSWSPGPTSSGNASPASH
jgi:predicted flavoprotein YhiN